jgi:predicted nucleic acid-binding protein
MRITDRQAQNFLHALYHTAEKDHNDVIANAASALAVRFEVPSSKGHLLTEIDQRLIRYAVSMKPKTVEVVNESRRKTYKRRVTVA